MDSCESLTDIVIEELKNEIRTMPHKALFGNNGKSKAGPAKHAII